MAKHTEEFKAKVLKAADSRRGSMAEVAEAHGINPNMIYAWRQTAKRKAERSEKRSAKPAKLAERRTVDITKTIPVTMDYKAECARLREQNRRLRAALAAALD